MEKKHQYQFIGACIIIALAVIFLPMLLDGNVNLDEKVQTQPMPIPPVHAFEPLPEPTEFVPLDKVLAADEAPAEAVSEPAVDPDPESSSAAVAPSEHSEAFKDDFVLPESKRMAPAADDLASWVVQVASLSDKTGALQLRDKLRAGGHAAFVQQSTVNGKAMFRVKVGPISEKAEAEQELQVIAKSFALSGIVISYP